MITTQALPGTDLRKLLPAVVLALAALYLFALDQGLLLSVIQGNLAFDQNMIHELVHDARHISAMPCH